MASEEDLNGYDRIILDTVDMGAYESARLQCCDAGGQCFSTGAGTRARTGDVEWRRSCNKIERSPPGTPRGGERGRAQGRKYRARRCGTARQPDEHGW